MFAGEGTPERTNRRFHYLSRGQDAARLSTAFDSVTLYGEDPHERPDIYGKVGNSGVSIATVDDMKKLYSGFDLCAPTTSVSMTINGPAPMILAFFMNTAIDQQVEKHLRETGGWDAAKKKIDQYFADKQRPRYVGELPPGNDGLGLGLLGISGEQLVDAQTYARIRKETMAAVRGTVQADILKEDQAQNTCIFSTEFAMKMMGDVQQFFIDNNVRNYYSVSISGYHIAEAGANPISQLAFTLVERVHDRRVLPGARHGYRRVCAEPELLLFQRHGSGILGDRSRRAPHLGARDARALRRERALADAEIPRADLRSQPARAGDQL